MKSFPSAFSKNKLVNKGLASGNIKQTLKNMADAMMNNILSGEDTITAKQNLGKNIKFYEKDFEQSIKDVSCTNSIVFDEQEEHFRIFRTLAPVYENANKIPALILAGINKYRRVYTTSAVQYGATGKNPDEVEKKNKNKKSKQNNKGGKNNKKTKKNQNKNQNQGENPADTADLQDFTETYQEGISPSLFNPWFGVRTQGFLLNSPLMYLKNKPEVEVMMKEGEDYNKDGYKIEPKKIQIDNMNGDFTDCSIKTLVNLSKKNPFGSKQNIGPGGFYRYADFMYCKELGKISNNHLITLRRFTHPIGDNIFKSPGKNPDLLPDKGRLITWFGTEDNKLEDICKFQYKTTWKQLDAKIDEIQSKEDQPQLLPSLMNITNGQYMNAANKNGQFGNNGIFQWAESKVSIFGMKPLAAQSQTGNDPDRYHRDQSKVWTPKNTIQSTHVYEGKIEFSQSFTLTFNYELRSYDGINPKTAFLDLLGNILEVTHNRGKFWGGERRWIGAPRNKAGWKRANELFDKMERGLDNAVSSLFGCYSFNDLAALCTEGLKCLGNMVNGLAETAAKMLTRDNLEKGTKVALKGVQGMLKNKLGRPAVYAMDSLLKGNDVGIWHLTIGNPRNPIMTIGNLIMENSELTQYGPLGIDDFPTGLKVVITLKHARPRDITDISSMYTCGQGGLLLTLNDENWRKFFNLKSNKSQIYFDDMYELGFGSLKAESIIGVDNLETINPATGKTIEKVTYEVQNPETGEMETKSDYKVPDNSMIDSMWNNIS